VASAAIDSRLRKIWIHQLGRYTTRTGTPRHGPEVPTSSVKEVDLSGSFLRRRAENELDRLEARVLGSLTQKDVSASDIVLPHPEQEQTDFASHDVLVSTLPEESVAHEVEGPVLGSLRGRPRAEGPPSPSLSAFDGDDTKVYVGFPHVST